MDDLTGRNRLDSNTLVPELFATHEAAGSAVCEAIKAFNDLINDQDGSTSLVSDAKKRVISDCIKSRREEVRTGLDNLMTCHSTNPQFLVDFDWKLKYVFSSNKMSEINEPLVNLDMKLSNGTVQSIEMDRKEVNQLLNTLKQAKESMT